MKRVRTIFYSVSALACGYAVFLSYQVDSDSLEDTADAFMKERGVAVAISLDSAKDGAAAGFAVLSGLALVAASITYLKPDTNEKNIL